MHTRRGGMGVGVLNGKIYAVGGTNDSQTFLSSVESYDPELDVWSPVADLCVPTFGARVGVVDGVLYCMGGYARNTVQKYSEDTNTWSLVAEMNYKRTDPGVIAHAGRLYVVGGYDGDIIHSSVEMYNPKTNSWTLVTDMAVGRRGPAVALINKPSTNESERPYFVS